MKDVQNKRHKANDFNWDGEIEEIKVYCVEFYPYTKYEVETE